MSDFAVYTIRDWHPNLGELHGLCVLTKRHFTDADHDAARDALCKKWQEQFGTLAHVHRHEGAWVCLSVNNAENIHDYINKEHDEGND